MEPQLDFARNIKAMESLKTELAGSFADLYKALFNSDNEGFLDASAKMTIACFLLSKRLGLNYGHLEKQVYNNIQRMLTEKTPGEECYHDIVTLRDYLELKR